MDIQPPGDRAVCAAARDVRKSIFARRRLQCTLPAAHAAHLKFLTTMRVGKPTVFSRGMKASYWTYVKYINRYYCESVGHISETTIKRYIEEQKGK